MTNATEIPTTTGNDDQAPRTGTAAPRRARRSPLRWAAGAAAAVAVSVGAAAPAHAVGALDPTFSFDGKVTTNVGGVYDVAKSVAVQPDGRILVAGFSLTEIALARYLPNGSWDASFGGGDGLVTTPFGAKNAVGSMALLPDGKIVVTAPFSLGLDVGSDFGLVRYHANGTVDTGFGGGDGIATVNVGRNDYAADLAIQADGKIVVAGTTWDNSGSDAAVARFRADGSLDPTFSGDGKVVSDLGYDDGIEAVAVDGSGRIVVAGDRHDGPAGIDQGVIARYSPGGSLEAGFGGDGLVTTESAQWNDVAVQADGKIVVAGSSQSDVALARLLSTGTPDAGFGSGGLVVSGTGDDAATTGKALRILGTGKILVAGRAEWSGGGNDFLLARYNANGTRDATFGVMGALTTDFGGHDSANALALQSDGKVVLAGTTEEYGLNGDVRFAVARYVTAPTTLTLG